MTSYQSSLDTYCQFFSTMTSESLNQLDQFFTRTARFKDPFNDVHSLDEIRRIFEHMFSTMESPQFIIDEAVLSSNIAYIKWQFSGLIKHKTLTLSGVSRVVFNSQGLVSEHIDYWDASEQFYMTLPIIGPLLRLIQRQLKI
jgi:steroid delta-isomerase